MYDLNKISRSLNTNIIGRSIIQYDSLDSTLTKAKNIFASCPDGTIILAEDQSESLRPAGEWFCSPDKNIYLSIILKSVTENYLLPLMDLVGCSSVLKSVEDLYGLDCRIKWPNDILINEKVFSSVKSDLGGKGSGIILSLNINVNMDEEMSDIKISSIKSEKDEDVEREILIGAILSKIENHYKEIINTGKVSNAVDKIYYKSSNFLFKRIINCDKLNFNKVWGLTLMLSKSLARALRKVPELRGIYLFLS
jgi:BirA family biotin operon repressor/biotin-[acetyl-CoA-carboxylase] ligase